MVENQSISWQGQFASPYTATAKTASRSSGGYMPPPQPAFRLNNGIFPDFASPAKHPHRADRINPGRYHALNLCDSAGVVQEFIRAPCQTVHC
jgi:hypothetical protein